MRKKIVTANWKMNKTYAEAQDFVDNLTSNNTVLEHLNNEKEVILATPYLYLPSLQEKIEDYPYLHISAQNCHQEAKGAYTGEISAAQLEFIGVEYVIIGHSERREYFGETDEIVLKKIKQALQHNLKVIFCCGEPLSIREREEYKSFILSQLEASIFQLSAAEMKHIVIAYEPIWAIGTGKTASSEQAQEVHAFIRTSIAQQFGTDIAQNMTILYGGSCNPQNASYLFAQEDVDGGLIGGASLNINDFEQIILAI